MKKEGKMITDNTKTLYNALEKIEKLQSENTRLQELVERMADNNKMVQGMIYCPQYEILGVIADSLAAYEAFKEGEK